MVNESLRVDANEIRSGDPLIDKIMRAHLNRRVSQTSPMDDLPPGIARLSDSSPAYEREFAEKVKQQLLSKRTPLTGSETSPATPRSYLKGREMAAGERQQDGERTFDEKEKQQLLSKRNSHTGSEITPAPPRSSLKGREMAATASQQDKERTMNLESGTEHFYSKHRVLASAKANENALTQRYRQARKRHMFVPAAVVLFGTKLRRRAATKHAVKLQKRYLAMASAQRRISQSLDNKNGRRNAIDLGLLEAINFPSGITALPQLNNYARHIKPPTKIDKLEFEDRLNALEHRLSREVGDPKALQSDPRRRRSATSNTSPLTLSPQMLRAKPTGTQDVSLSLLATPVEISSWGDNRRQSV